MEFGSEFIVNIQHRTIVVELVAVVLSGENSDQMSELTKELISILCNLMCSAYQIKVMFGNKLVKWFPTE